MQMHFIEYIERYVMGFVVGECSHAVTVMSEGAEMVISTAEGDSRAFDVKVGLSQGSELSLCCL